MKLSHLIESIDPLSINGQIMEAGGPPPAADWSNLDVEITSIHYRAQEVRPGGLFVAVPGHRADGHDFIDQALKNGASAVVVQREVEANAEVIRVAGTRMALADLSARFYKNPAEHLTVIGITGTNGKTTIAYLIESIFEKAGFRVGVIGTINYRYSGREFNNPITTPESLDLQKILAEMLKDGTTHVILEASSHAIDLYRIKNCWFDVALFTNLSQDHLDFHGDMQTYWASKKRLFTEYLVQGPKKDRARAVVNCDDPMGMELAGILKTPILKTGTTESSDIRAAKAGCSLSGICARVVSPEGGIDITSPLVGKHNLENILGAIGAGIAMHVPIKAIRDGIASLSSVPGRLEYIANKNERFVYVDYAHTPDALENVLTALKALSEKRIICVFGCGGDRDNAKRALMGEIAADLSDLSVITSDNPRTEEPMAIIHQILEGTRRLNGYEYKAEDLQRGLGKKGYFVEPDRHRAIAQGIRSSQPGDTVLIAGKGHETYQILGHNTIAFDDREEARKMLALMDTDQMEF